MPLVRKLIVVLVGVSLAVLVTVLLLNPDTMLRLAQNMSDTSALIRVPLVILFDIVVLAVIIVLVRSTRVPHPTSGLMVKAQGAIADVSVESTRDRILRAVRAVPDVISADAEVKALHGKADVELDVVVSRESTNVPEKQREIDRALRQVINKQLGLQMAGKPRVHIRMDDEKGLNPPVELVAPVVVTADPVKSSDVAEVPEVKREEALKVETIDTMSLRGDSETKPDSSETSTPG